MANMSYCRFQNTLGDLEDCFENIDDIQNMSDEEKEAREQLIDICCDIAIENGWVVDRDVQEV